MNPNQSLEIQLVSVSDATAIQINNMLVELHFFINGQFRYAFNVGRTTTVGSLTVTYDGIEKLRQKHAQYNIMDYNDMLDRCDSTLAVILLSEKELRKRLDYAVKVFEKKPDWADPWPSNSKLKVQPVSVELRDQTTHLQIPCEVVG